MNLLIVDDEYYSVENLRNKLDWQSLGFEKILCAYSMEQAKELFKQNKIDLLLSDIEMPKGSGLELLEWIRSEKMRTVCIFLTCFAKFDYASQAIRLESSDYLLKPVDKERLQEAVDKAIVKIRQAETELLNELHAEYWLGSGIQRTEQFWRRVADGSIPPFEQSLRKEIHTLHLPDTMLSRTICPVFLECLMTDSMLQWEPNVYEYALKNILNELMFHEEELPAIVKMEKWKYILIIPCIKEKRKKIIEACRQAQQACCTALPGIFRFYIGDICPPEKTAEAGKALYQAARNNIVDISSVYDLPTISNGQKPMQPLPLDRWSDLLLSRRIEDVRREAIQHLQEIARQQQADRRDLINFYYDFSQVLYTLLERSGAAAHKLFADASTEQFSEHACDSLPMMEQWVTHILTAYMECLIGVSESGTVIENVKRYIREHLSDELSRNELADAVFVSPDYLSHLFREKTGMSLTTYITNERIRKAKELLLKNQFSIRDTALTSGFQNISYFSKQFKRATGQTPQEFRRG